MRCIGARRGNLCEVPQRGNQCAHHQDCQEEEEQRVQHLPDPRQDFPRPERKEQHHAEKEQGEHRQSHGLPRSGQDPFNPDRVGNRRASGDRKERPDRKIKHAGKEKPVPFPDPAAQPQQPFLAADSQRGHPQKRQPPPGDQEASGRLPKVPACHLPHGSWKNQIARPKEHAKQHTRHNKKFFQRPFLHRTIPQRFS